MLAITEPKQDDPETWPRTGVRLSIAVHPQAVGGYRVRFSFAPAVAKILRRGLTFPRLHVDGTMMTGFRVWCVQDGTTGGLAPVVAHSGAWAITMPGHRLRCRREAVSSTDVDFEWTLNDSGPLLLIPRLPDAMVPAGDLATLPNSQVDPETIMQRADARLSRGMAKLHQDAPEIDAEPDASPVLAPAGSELPALPSPAPEPEPEPEPPAAPDPGTFRITGRITNPDLLDGVAALRELLKMMREHADVTAKINMPPELDL